MEGNWGGRGEGGLERHRQQRSVLSELTYKWQFENKEKTKIIQTFKHNTYEQHK
jgi:hypothetical protein